MELEPADPAEAGLNHLVATLCRQLDVTRQQVLSLQKLKEKKESLLQTGYNVLEQHCAASSLGPDAQFQSGNLNNNNFQASMTRVAPCPSGWEVSIQVQGPPEVLDTLSITITAIPPGNGVHGCIIRQLEEATLEPTATATTTEAAAAVAVGAVVTQRASALIELQGFPMKINNTTVLEMYVLLASSSSGTLYAAVPAGRITLDRTEWLHSFGRFQEKKGNGDEEKEQQHTTAWPHAAHFSVKLHSQIGNSIDINWLDTLLVQQLGFSPSSISTDTSENEGGRAKKWCLGTAAEAHGSPGPINGAILFISIYGESKQIVWSIQVELKVQLEERMKAVHSHTQPPKLPLPKWIQMPSSFTNKQQKNADKNMNMNIKASVDALLAELDALTTWIEALKKQHAAGNSILARQNVLIAQAAAVDSMIHTDATAIAVAHTHNFQN